MPTWTIKFVAKDFVGEIASDKIFDVISDARSRGFVLLDRGELIDLHWNFKISHPDPRMLTILLLANTRVNFSVAATL